MRMEFKGILKKSISMILIFSLCFVMMAAFSTTESCAAGKTHLKKSTVTLTIGATYQQKLLASNNKAIKGSSVKWSSNNKAVASITKTGKVTANSIGTATMNAKYKGKTYKFKVRVNNGLYSIYEKNVNISFVGGSTTIESIGRNVNCGRGIDATVVEGKGVVQIEVQKSIAGKNFCNLKITALDSGSARIKVYVVGNNSAVQKNCRYINVTVKGNPEGPTLALIEKLTERTIEILRENLRDPYSLQVYNTSVEWLEFGTYARVAIDYGARNGFGGMNRDVFYMYWKTYDGTRWTGQMYPF